MAANLQSFSDPERFLGETQDFLEARESANSLILGIATRLKTHPNWTRIPPYLALYRGAEIVLAALMTPPQKLLLTRNPQTPLPALEAAINTLIQDLNAGGWQVPGITAERELAEQFSGQWQQVTGQTVSLIMRMRAYELRQVIPPTNPPPGSLRQATPADQQIAARWHYAFSRESLHEGDENESQEHAAQRIQSGDIFFWDDHGPVSMAVRSRPTVHGYSIGGVYTPPELRGRGYASACVAALSQLILNGGKQFCALFTDLDYPTSNSIYQKIGYQPVCDFFTYEYQA